MKTENTKPNIEEVFAMSLFGIPYWAARVRMKRYVAFLVQIIDGEIVNADIEHNITINGVYSREGWYILDIAGAIGTPYYDNNENFKKYSAERAKESLEQKLMALYTKIDTAEFKKELAETWHIDILPYKQTFFDMTKNRGNQFTFQKESLN